MRQIALKATLILGCSLVLSPLASAAVSAPVAPGPSDRTSTLLSRSLSGGIPNGPSRRAVVSHDQRLARWIAYESDGSDIVAGDTNAHTDVFAIRRDPPYSTHGTPWRAGATVLVSAASDGGAANGPSWGASLDGDSHHRPRCAAFVSAASNLVPGDTNGQPDAFVRDLSSGRTKRVSVDARGRQANGPTTEVSIDGACERVAFIADAPSLALRRTANPAWRSARTSVPRRGVPQAYVHVLGGGGKDAGFRGLTFAASASRFGKVANGSTREVSFARAGKDVVFTSEATNLAAGDRGRGADVYLRSFERRFAHLGHGKGAQTLAFETRLVSSTPGGRAGNGPSSHSTSTDDGRFVVFETLASDVLASDANGVSDIARADMKRGRVAQRWVSRSAATGIGNGPSNRPVISDAGLFVLFDSEASNLRQHDLASLDENGKRDVFLWNAPTGNVSLESRDSDNALLPAASQAPSASSRGNYVPFESAYPLIDRPLAQALFPQALADPATLKTGILPALAAPSLPALSLPGVSNPRLGIPGVSARVARAAKGPRARAAAEPVGALQQVYLRFLGPK
ncbi:MAG: hypothetical protein H0T15_09910 [Thermoleophilaceae bacterium]|nr:hypothetical protein [Thermoleophilaceae bacterium]